MGKKGSKYQMKIFFLGREYQKNDPAVTVDFNTTDPVVHWDSYENFNQRYQDSLEGKILTVFFKTHLSFIFGNYK